MPGTVDRPAISRSQFLRDGLRTFVRFAADTVRTPVCRSVVPLHRPPGAVNELEFLTRCVRCDDCFTACPHQSLHKAGAEYGAAAGTPVIIPDRSPCYLCQDTPCITACKSGALRSGAPMKMGTAHLIQNRCLAFQGQICDYCYTHCPAKGIAIVMEQRKPRVLTDACLGCGVCEYLCPAPGNGILVAPDPVL